MEILIFILVGIINGLFSSGAGQILIFYWVYILKKDTKLSRNLSLSIMPIVSIPTFIYYLSKVDVSVIKCVVLVSISILFGWLGNSTINKINGKILNLISGIFLVIITCYSLWRLK